MDRIEIQRLLTELETAAAGHRSAARRHRKRAQQAALQAQMAERLARLAEVQLAMLRHDLGHPMPASKPDVDLTFADGRTAVIEVKRDSPRKLSAKAAIEDAFRRHPQQLWSPRTLAVYVLRTESVAITPANIQMQLRRMLDRGEVERVKHGWYRPDTGPAVSQGRVKPRASTAGSATTGTGPGAAP